MTLTRARAATASPALPSAEQAQAMIESHLSSDTGGFCRACK